MAVRTSDRPTAQRDLPIAQICRSHTTLIGYMYSPARLEQYNTRATSTCAVNKRITNLVNCSKIATQPFIEFFFTTNKIFGKNYVGVARIVDGYNKQQITATMSTLMSQISAANKALFRITV